MKRVPQISSLQMLGVSHVIAAAILLCFVFDELVLLYQATLLSYVLILGLCMLVARILYYYAYSKVDVSEVTIFSALTPAYTLIIAPLFGFTVGWQEALGILVISIAVYFFFLPPRNKSISMLRYLLLPFQYIISSPPILCTFISTVPPVFAVIVKKQAIDISSPLLVSFGMCAVIGVLACALMLCWKPQKADQPARQCGSLAVGLILIIAGALQAIMIVSTSYLLEQTHPASMQALIRLAIPVQIILAYLLLREKTQLSNRLLWSVLAVAGGYVVIQAN